MLKTSIMKNLKAHKADLQRFHVISLGIFGSVARGEERLDSDVDILVQFDGPTRFDWYIGLKEYLEDLFDRKVDLVTEASLKPLIRPYVEKDLIRVT
jgi:predicted nucleotidyltransferase